jgi:ubiquitin
MLSVSIALLLIMATDQTAMTADDVPEVFNYSFDEVDSIKIYAGPVVFSHAKHVTDYGLSCNACHHTLENEEMEVEEHCSDCHTEPWFVRGKEAEELSEDELIEHYLNALHVQCIGCHKQKKIENRQRKIPVGCTQCHDRRKLPSPK